MRRSSLLMLLLCALTHLGATPPSLQSQCDALLAKWRPAFDDARLNAVVAPPFVIAGDAPDARLRQYRDQTVLAATSALQAQFFAKHPTEPVLILLFESRGPYVAFAKAHFADPDPPHYGYYRHRDNAMLMNVGTGTGTLVHELAHALIKPDFPAVPSWFNEGLASLYEQCSIDGQSINGLPNWRLPALQRAILADKLRPLHELIEDPDFYADARVGINYAQARYLMLYLQEKNLLQRYYRTFRDAGDRDRTGLDSLQKTIDPMTLDEFEQAWRDWVLSLRFGG